MTRTQNSFFNMVTGVGSELLVILLNFITRSVFLRTLGSDYLGIEGYFSNVLSVLNLTNLGFSTAIIYKLYRPIQENDRRRIQVLMQMYRQVYFAIGCVIGGLGILLMPFLPQLVKDYGRLATLGLNGAFVFSLYLFKSVASYWFFAYKNSFVRANQKSYILSLVGYVVNIADSLSQIIVLLVFRDFFAYLFTLIGFIILRNIINAVVCDRRYPFLKEKVTERVSREELKGIFKDCSAMMLHRISSVIMGSSDNIVLAKLVGLTPVGLYANYLIIKSNLSSLVKTIVNSAEASLGSLHSADNVEWSRLGFRTINFFSMWLYGVCSIGLAVLFDEFIALWIGKQFVVDSWTYGDVTIRTPLALLIGIEFYLGGQLNYCRVYRNITGTFRQLKYRPLASVVINLGVSLALVPYTGIAGCVIGTIVAYLSTYLIFDPAIICRVALKQSPRGYYLRNILYKLVVAAAGVLCWWLCSLIKLSGIPGFIIHGFVCVLVPSGIFALCYHRTAEFRFLLHSGLDMLARYMPATREADAPSEDAGPDEH